MVVFMDEAISEYLLHLELSNKSPNTLRAAREDLTLFREWVELNHNGMVEPGEVTEEDVASYLLHLKEAGRTPATRRRRLTIIRAFFGYLVRRGFLPSSPALDVPLPSLERRVRRYLEPDELQKFVKGAKNPIVSYYLSEVRPKLNTGFVFVTTTGPLKPGYLGDLMRREAKRMGFEGIAPHSFRHSFATQLWRKNVDVLAISALLGHSSPQTTAIYAHVHPQILKEAVSRLVGIKG